MVSVWLLETTEVPYETKNRTPNTQAILLVGYITKSWNMILKEISEYQCSLQHYLQSTRDQRGSIYPPVSEGIKGCGVYIQYNIIKPSKNKAVCRVGGGTSG